MLPTLVKSQDKIIPLVSLARLAEDYLENQAGNYSFFKDIKQGLPKKWDQIPPEDKSHYFRILAMIAYEKSDWFNEKPLDFIKMAIEHAQTEPDSIASYRQIIPAYVEKIYSEFDNEEKKKIKTELDKYYDQIMNWESNSGYVKDLKYKAKHNLAIVERQMQNFDNAIGLFENIAKTQIDFNDDIYYKLELRSNTINELGRAYLSKGIFENKNELIDTAIVKFNQAIDLLESNSCAPSYLSELYERKQKALRLIDKYNDAKKMDGKIKKFQLNSCVETKSKFYPYLSRRINWDLSKMEIENDISVINIAKNNALTKNAEYLKLLIFGLVSGLFLLGFLCWKLYDKNKKLNSLVDISDTIIKNIKKAGENYNRRVLLDENLPTIYDQFKGIINKASGITAVLFDRENAKVVYKKVEVDKLKGYNSPDAKKQDVDIMRSYYPYYDNQSNGYANKTYDEPNYQANFKKHNTHTKKEYLIENNITTESIICEPIVLGRNEELYGIITFQSDKKHSFKENHRQFIKVIKNIFSIAIQYYEAMKEREKTEQERKKIKSDRDRIIGIVTHRFRNFFDVKNSALQSIELNLERWDKETLKQRLLGLGGDFQITKSLFDSFILWMEFIGKRAISTDKKDFNLCKVINAEVSQLHLALKENKIAHNINCKGEIIIQNLPRIFIKEIIANLIINSIQHFINNDVEKPAITIDVIEDDDYLILNIIDNGSGIPEVIQKNMFAEGFSSEYNKDKISGFGNKIIKGIIDEINGKVKIIHSNEQNGTNIQISIPNKYKKQQI